MRYAALLLVASLALPLPGETDPGVPAPVRLAAQTDQAGEAAPATRTEPTRVHPEAQKAIDRLKSPFCPGFMLEVCPSPQAQALRDSIDALARQGLESDSLVALVLAAHGEEWRAMPEARGGGLLAWLVPPAALLLGVLVVVVVLRRFVGPRDAEAEEGVEISVEEEERLRMALDELEAEEEPLF